MRCAFIVAAIHLSVLVCAAHPAVAQAELPSNSADAAAGTSQPDAAEIHAKRTACLKEAKTKKLVGEQKASFVKDCMSTDAPKPAPSKNSPASG